MYAVGSMSTKSGSTVRELNYWICLVNTERLLLCEGSPTAPEEYVYGLKAKPLI